MHANHVIWHEENEGTIRETSYQWCIYFLLDSVFWFSSSLNLVTVSMCYLPKVPYSFLAVSL